MYVYKCPKSLDEILALLKSMAKCLLAETIKQSYDLTLFFFFKKKIILFLFKYYIVQKWEAAAC